MVHLGERVTALVDGQLPVEAMERAHAHLASCRPCRDLVEAERLMKSRLASMQGPPPTPDLVARLLALGGPEGPMAPRERHVPGTPRPNPVTRPRPAARPAGRPAAAIALAVPLAGVGPGRGRRRRTRLTVAVLGALTVVGAGIGGLAVANAGSAGPTLVPPVATFVVDHADTTSTLPFVDVPAGWQVSDGQSGAAAAGGAGK